MEKKNLPQIARQLRIFFVIWASEYHLSPREIMRLAGIKNRMMLKRDLEDIRGSGLFKAMYISSKRGGVYVIEKSEFDESVGDRKKAHLRHLKRLADFLTELEPVDPYMLGEYKEGLREYDEVTAELRRIDAIAKYRELFPECSDRTRQRDFAVINAAGRMNEEELAFKLYHPRGFKSPVFKCEAILYER